MKILLALLLVLTVASALPKRRYNLRYKYARQDQETTTVAPDGSKDAQKNTPSIVAIADPVVKPVTTETVAAVVDGVTTVKPAEVTVATKNLTTTTTTVAPDEDDDDDDDDSSEEDYDEDEDESDEDDDADEEEYDDLSDESVESSSEESPFGGPFRGPPGPVIRYTPPGKPIPGNAVRNLPPVPMDAYIPGYVTDQGEILVPIDTVVDRNVRYTIVPDPVLEAAVENEHVLPVIRQEAEPDDTETDGYSGDPSPLGTRESPFGAPFPSVEDDDEDEDGSSVESSVPVRKTAGPLIQVRPKLPDSESTSVESSDEDEDAVIKSSDPSVNEVAKPPLALLPARLPTNEDDEEDHLARRNHLWRYFAPVPYYPPSVVYEKNTQGRRLISQKVPYLPPHHDFYEPRSGLFERDQLYW